MQVADTAQPLPAANAAAGPHYLLFTGHMVDAPGRQEPRFPASKEAAAAADIRRQVAAVAARHPGRRLFGIAGGASGGDILFHEACEVLGIESAMYLALPKDALADASVAFAGAAWLARFDRLYDALPHPLLDEASPAQEDGAGESVWERCNLWMLRDALQGGGRHMTLIALWDGKGGDGPGGTAHMVQEARSRGSEVVVIDPAGL